MELQTERLALQDLSLVDLTAIHQLHSIPEVDEYNTLGIPESIQITEVIVKDWLSQQKATPRMSYTLSIRLLANNDFIGLIALNLGKPNFKIAEVWYKLHPVYWRQGYAKEALAKLLEFAFLDLKLHRVEAGCAVDNIASIRVLENAGMRREGTKRKVLPIRGNWVDNYSYAMLEVDFEEVRLSSQRALPLQ